MNGVLRVLLYDTTRPDNKDILLNKVLVDEGYATKCEENHISRVGHVRVTWWSHDVIVPIPFQLAHAQGQLIRDLHSKEERQEAEEEGEGRGEANEDSVPEITPICHSTNITVKWDSHLRRLATEYGKMIGVSGEHVMPVERMRTVSVTICVFIGMSLSMIHSSSSQTTL